MDTVVPKRPWAVGIEMPRMSEILDQSGLFDSIAKQYSPTEYLPRIPGIPGFRGAAKAAGTFQRRADRGQGGNVSLSTGIALAVVSRLSRGYRLVSHAVPNQERGQEFSHRVAADRKLNRQNRETELGRRRWEQALAMAAVKDEPPPPEIKNDPSS
jgi:hypothetical protein